MQQNENLTDRSEAVHGGMRDNSNEINKQGNSACNVTGASVIGALTKLHKPKKKKENSLRDTV